MRSHNPQQQNTSVKEIINRQRHERRYCHHAAPEGLEYLGGPKRRTVGAMGD